jgi:hypothetical protein
MSMRRASFPTATVISLVVQFKQASDARPQNFRFKLETHLCGGCNRAEYACICDQ